MKRSNLIVSLTTLGVVAIAIPTFAFRGNMNTENNADFAPRFSEETIEERRAAREDHRAQVQEAFEANNYNAWVEVMSSDDREPPILGVITEENFDRFVEMHEAMEAKDFELAEEIRAELELPMKGNVRRGRGMKGNGHGMRGMGQGNCSCPNATK